MNNTASKLNTDLSAIENLSFEQAMSELEVIVKNLENGKIPLEEAITTYERGAAIRLHCEKKLKEAKLKVDQITSDQEGNLKIQTIEESET